MAILNLGIWDVIFFSTFGKLSNKLHKLDETQMETL